MYHMVVFIERKINMTLKTCLEIGKECGLTTIEECYDNIYIHAQNIFVYSEINKELLELQKDIFYNYPDEFVKIFNCSKKDLIAKGWKVKGE